MLLIMMMIRRIMMRMVIIVVVNVKMIMRMRMLLIMVLSQWQRRGGRGKEHHGVRSPNQGHRTRQGGLCKNLLIANWSPESRVHVVGILAFWFGTLTIYVKCN